MIVSLVATHVVLQNSTRRLFTPGLGPIRDETKAQNAGSFGHLLGDLLVCCYSDSQQSCF